MAGVGSDMVAPFRSARELGSSSGQPVFFNLLPKHGHDKHVQSITRIR